MHAKVEAAIERSTRWTGEMRRLRDVLRGCGLDETFKWGKPCYSSEGKNIVIMQEMKHFLALMFFNGALLDDPAGVLESQGENSRSARRICFRSVDDVDRLAGTLPAYVANAVQVERDGLEVGPAPDVVLADELQRRLDADPALRDAFAALTPGRRREYNMHIAGAKQPATRAGRVDTCVAQILAGKGLRDRR